jgi:hypothetical protein
MKVMSWKTLIISWHVTFSQSFFREMNLKSWWLRNISPFIINLFFF